MSVNLWQRKDLLSIQDLTREEIMTALETAKSYKELLNRPIKKVPTLRGKTVALFFCENSTRTRISFELAAKRLSADTINIAAGSSSITKGETLADTAQNLEALKINVIIVRHPYGGAAHILSRSVKASVINAGDGYHEHPTQCLLDLFTILEKKGRLEGLKVTIIGDILHSRVARSNLWGLLKCGAHVTLCAAPTMIPRGIEKLGVTVTHRLQEAIEGADVINCLRIQFERDSGTLLPSIREYGRLFGINGALLKYIKPDALIMHPGPINRGVEITSAMADGSQSVILEQVTNGLAVRMAALYLVSGGDAHE